MIINEEEIRSYLKSLDDFEIKKSYRLVDLDFDSDDISIIMEAIILLYDDVMNLKDFKTKSNSVDLYKKEVILKSREEVIDKLLSNRHIFNAFVVWKHSNNAITENNSNKNQRTSSR